MTCLASLDWRWFRAWPCLALRCWAGAIGLSEATEAVDWLSGLAGLSGDGGGGGGGAMPEVEGWGERVSGVRLYLVPGLPDLDTCGTRCIPVIGS